MRYALFAAIVACGGSTLFISAPGGDKIAAPIRLGRPAPVTAMPGLHRTSIAYAPDGKKLAWVHVLPEIAPNDGGRLLIHVWDLDKKIPIVEMKPANEFTYACSPIRFSPSGKMIIAGCFQLTKEVEELAKPETLVKNSVRVWLIGSGRELPVPMIKREDGPVPESWQAVAVGKDGLTIVGVNSKNGRVWTLPDGEVSKNVSFEPAEHLILTLDGKFAAGTTKDKSVRVWLVEDGKELAKLPEGGRALAFSPDGKQLVTSTDDRISLWQLDESKQTWSVPARFDKGEPRLDFASDGKRLAWNENGKITIVEAAAGKGIVTLAGEAGPIAFAPDGQRLAVGCPDGTALVWDLKVLKGK